MNNEESATLNDEIPVPIIKPSWLHPVGVAVKAISISTDGLSVAFATEEGGLKVLESVKGEVLFEVESADSFFGVSSLEFSPDAKFLAIALENGWIRIFDVAEKQEIRKQHFPKQMPENLLWKRDSSQVFFIIGKSIASISLDATTDASEILCSEENTITAMRWVDGKMLGYTTYSHFKVVEAHTGTIRQDFSWKGSLISLEICPNKKYAVCGTQDQTIRIWNLSTKKDLEMRGFHSKVKQMSFREDGHAMAHATQNEVIVWDFSGQGPSGKKPQILGPFEIPAVGVWYQNQGQKLVSAGKDGIVLFWNPDESLNPIAISGIRDQEITCCQWSPKDDFLVLGFSQGYVVLIPFEA